MQLPSRKGAQQSPTFRAMPIVTKRSPISATAEPLLYTSVSLYPFYLIAKCHYHPQHAAVRAPKSYRTIYYIPRSLHWLKITERIEYN